MEDQEDGFPISSSDQFGSRTGSARRSYCQCLVRSSTLLVLCALVSVCSGLQQELTYSLQEEVDQGTFVANVLTDTNLQEHYHGNQTILSQLRFRFLKKEQVVFVIEEMTGVIRTSGRLDRDAVCPNAEECSMRLDVAVQPVQYFHIIKITLDIEDINDNRPTFPQRQIEHSMLESALLDSSFVIPTAVDMDSPAFSVQRYELLPKEVAQFRLRLLNKVDGSMEVRLVLKQELDREVESKYNLRVVAYDGGVKTGSVEVQVNVLDVNDNHPTFEHPTYEVLIREDVAALSTFLQVKATDPDYGINRQITYGFSQTTLADYGHLFGIRENSGDLYVKGTVNYESASIYHLVVTAMDQGSDSIPGDATVVVKVMDINDHAPHISLTTLSSDANRDVAEVPENSAPGTFVAHITVTDEDSGQNAVVNCSISDAHFQLKYLYDTEYQILTSTILDRESKKKFSLKLTCRDGGDPAQSTVETIVIRVTDENDHQPVFNQNFYAAELIENNYEGAAVVQVRAVDLDAGPNAELTYSISENMQRFFEVKPNSGIISALVSMDREQMGKVEFDVVVTDHGQPPRSSSALVTVFIQDVNDERPKFSQSSYSFGVFENEPVGTEVGMVSADDADSPPFNQFTYSLLSSDTETFEIDSLSGRLTSTRLLDRERQSIFSLVIVAREQGVPALSSTVNVAVYVADKNDNPPKFIHPAKKNTTISIASNLPKRYMVMRIRARDQDIGNNGLITYKIIGGNERVYFDLEPELGTLMVNKDLSDLTDGEMFNLDIMAEDNGLPQHREFVTLNLKMDESLNFPSVIDGGGTSAEKAKPVLTSTNLTIVITVAVVSAIITTVLVITIILIRRQDPQGPRSPHKYNCRLEALKFLKTRGSARRPLSSESTASTDSNGSNGALHIVPGATVTDGVGERIVRKKEVSFSLDIEHGVDISGNNKSWPSTINLKTLQYPQASSSVLTHDTTGSPSGTGAGAGAVPGDQQVQLHPVTQLRLTKKELEVHQLLHMLKHTHENASLSSVDGSNADSGRGPSEEGEARALTTRADRTDAAPSHIFNTALHLVAPQQYLSMEEESFMSNQVVPSLPNISMGSSAASRSTSYLGSYRPASRTRNCIAPSMYQVLEEPSPVNQTQSTIGTESTILSSSAADSFRNELEFSSYVPKSCIADETIQKERSASPPLSPPATITKTTVKRKSRSLESQESNPAPPILPPRRRPLRTPASVVSTGHHYGYYGNSDGEESYDCSEAPTCSVIQYSCADMSDVLHTKTPGELEKDNEDASTITTGSYTVDAHDICDEIDELFFRDMGL